MAGKEWVDKVFQHNPGMNEVYPGESRYILDAFVLGDPHAQQKADGPGQQDGLPRQEEVLPQQAQERCSSTIPA